MKIKKKIVFIMTISLLIFLLASILIPYVKYKTFKIPKNLNTSDIKIVGHRGAAGLAPENTKSSFIRALEIGVDIIELDIHLSADNELIVMHDSNIKRTTNGKGEIENLTLLDIKKLDAGSWFHQKYKSEKVLILEEVFEIVNNQCPILIEIKWPTKGIYNGIVEKLINVLEKNKNKQKVIIQSFEPYYLKKILQLKPNLKCHQLIFGKSSLLPFYYDRKLKFGEFIPVEKIESINSFFPYINTKYKTNSSQNNLQFGVFTVNKENDIKKVVAMGARYIITDYPDLAIKTLSQ